MYRIEVTKHKKKKQSFSFHIDKISENGRNIYEIN